MFAAIRRASSLVSEAGLTSLPALTHNSSGTVNKRWLLAE
jgi:hypothetical protein